MKPISKDLRSRVINYLESDCNYGAASRKFEVSESSVRRWYLKYKKTGSYEAIPYPGKKARLTKLEFVNYVLAHSNSTLAQIGSYFNMTARSAHYYMRKFGLSYKKKSRATWKQRNIKEKNIENR